MNLKEHIKKKTYKKSYKRLFTRAYKTKNIQALIDLKIMLCMNCGCCTYVCPANRKLAEVNQIAKFLVPKK